MKGKYSMRKSHNDFYSSSLPTGSYA